MLVRTVATDHARLDTLHRQVEQDALTPRVADAIPAEKAPEAHRRLEPGGVRGRSVLTFDRHAQQRLPEYGDGTASRTEHPE